MTNWTEFTIEDLGFAIVKPDVYHKRQVKACIDDGIEYITRTKFNNGVTALVERPAKDVNPAGVISFGAENATFFYRPKPWISGRDIYYIDTRRLKQSACLFLATCLQKVAGRYPYNFGLFPDLLQKEVIKLPCKNGEPDYEFMDAYIKKQKALLSNKS